VTPAVRPAPARPVTRAADRRRRPPPRLLMAGRPAPARPVRQPVQRRLRRTLTGWAFAGPATLVVAGLTIFPAVWAFLISRQRWNGISRPRDIGWRNYHTLATDPDLFAAMRHTIVFTALFVPGSVVLGLLLAIALNQRIRLTGFYRTCIFVPYVASAAATGILANFVFNPQFGIANAALRAAHLPQQQFLESRSEALIMLCVIALWGEIGFTVVIFLAALQDIPHDVVEAALVDGARRRHVFRYVTVPHIAPVTVFTTVWQTITALQLFDLVFTTTKGGPLGATQTIVYYVYAQAFQVAKLGYASTVAYGLFAVTLVITLGLLGYARRARIEAF
jgi:multiple sugar transport system permease protein